MECKCRSNLIILMGINEDLLLVFRKLTLFLKIAFNIIRWEKIEKNRKSWQFSRGEYNSEFDYWRSLNSSFCVKPKSVIRPLWCES